MGCNYLYGYQYITLIVNLISLLDIIYRYKNVAMLCDDQYHHIKFGYLIVNV
ncbi:hypothetical protein XBI1_1420058 [Xenorhabdus bovienii str. Intermedium]|uniref:Uncharacterized protein n=1 Tax=Xenorhabdus bovienii str. Intermedium TaxID=1379677 RepID=A0A077QE04_XENBV|nr:hypothetical protein XBI1_1420058 [Xenorhabdus bovienii str. Intermedium]